MQETKYKIKQTKQINPHSVCSKTYLEMSEYLEIFLGKSWDKIYSPKLSYKKYWRYLCTKKAMLVNKKKALGNTKFIDKINFTSKLRMFKYC